VSDVPDKPQAHDVPQSFWEKVKAKPWTYAGMTASIVIPLIIGSWLLFQSSGGFTSWPGVEDEAIETSRGVEIPESAVETTTSESTTVAPADESAEENDRTAAVGGHLLAPVIAYRQSGAIYVAAEDGSAPQQVATSDRGAFRLSPDGTKLAWINNDEGTLHVTTVGGPDATVGPAEDVAPAWAPDSAWLAYTAPSSSGTEVHRVAADGTGAAKVTAGHTPRVSDDGSSMALISSAGPGQPGDVVVVASDGARLGGISGAMAIEAVPTGDSVVYSVGGERDAEKILVSATDGSDSRTLVGAARLGVPVVYAQLMPSPDGTLLKYAATGDDGYSRAYVVEISDTPSPLALSIRRDTYPLRWGSDGARLVIVEGNSFQGEQTSVIRVSGDGFGRTIVVEGGGL